MTGHTLLDTVRPELLLRNLPEVNAYVQTLLAHGRVAMEDKQPMSAVAAKAKTPYITTHVIRSKGGKRVLERVRFACGH